MKKILFITILVLSFTQASIAQDQEKNTYPLVVSFQSQCCGVPSDTVIRKFISSYKKKYKIKKITAHHIGPMGKEGEYYLAFKLKELTKKRATDFISKIKKVRKLKSDEGLFSFTEKLEIDPANLSKRATITAEVF